MEIWIFHLHSPFSLPLFLSNHLQKSYQPFLFLFRKRKLIHLPTLHPPIFRSWIVLHMIPLSVTTLILLIAHHQVLVFSLRTYTMSFIQVLAFTVHQLISPHHLLFNQKLVPLFHQKLALLFCQRLVLHWSQILNFKPPQGDIMHILQPEIAHWTQLFADKVPIKGPNSQSSGKREKPYKGL